MELSRTGAPTAWDGGYAPLGPYVIPGGAPGGVVRVDVRGDLLVTAGAMAGATRLAVFPLSGSTAPSGLRTRALGDQVEFTWDAATHPPPGGYVVEGGFAAGQTAVTLPVGSGTSFTTPAAVIGPAFVRVRSNGDADVSNEVVFGCLAPPLPPTALTTTLNGTSLTLSWTASAGAVTNYTLLAGSASGLTDVATLPVGASTNASGQVPGGTFFARVTASNACGTSGPSGEVFFTIGAPDALPAAPTNLAANLFGSTLTLSWTAPAGPVTGYVLEAGSAPGLANIGAATVGVSPSFVIPNVPPGFYYVRARATTSAGSGAASADVLVFVP